MSCPVQAGPTTPSSDERTWVDAYTETYFKTTYTDKKKNSGEVTVPANTTSYTFQNAPSGVTFTNYVQACNQAACGRPANTVLTGTDPKFIKNNSSFGP